jgi:histidyl-tRNA synthetase
VSERLQAVRGMIDVLPDQSYVYRFLERTVADCLSTYGYREIRMPLLESTQLFKRSIGEVTDIVEKEMYTFTDRNGDSLTLRPEGTAGCVRACLEHGLLHNQQQKLWYSGPMFRHEKPQKGRYRQFNQLGVEAFGIAGVGIELEMIVIGRRLWEALGLLDALTLQINTLGELTERKTYRDRLVSYFRDHMDALDEDSQRRLETNPLRILDSKNPSMQSLIQAAPQLMDSLGAPSRQHFLDLCTGLDTLGINYQVNPCLVRGLDYYEHTVFEWVTDELGSQSTVCAGGRFDKLVEHLGGKPTPAFGFAIGIERVLLLMDAVARGKVVEPLPTIYIVVEGEKSLLQAFSLAETLRSKDPTWTILVHASGGSFKNQFKKADKSGARLALILGEDEVRLSEVGIKDLRGQREPQRVPQEQAYATILTYLGE